MPKNVMKLVKPSPHRARNAFDLSHRHVMTQNFGELIPATCIETVPGDHIEISVANLLRAIPMVTSPFLRAKQHVDLWFVPYRDLWHNFDNFITQKVQPVSSALGQANYLPHTDIHTLYTNGAANGVTLLDIAGRRLAITSAKLLHYLGYADDTHASSTDPSGVNLFRIAAYQYIWYNEYRQQYYDDGTRLLNPSENAAHIFNFDDLPCDTLAKSDITYDTFYSTRLMGMCQMRYRCWKKDLFTGALPATQFGNISSVSSVTLSDLNRWTLSNGQAMAAGANVVVSADSLFEETSQSLIDHTHAYNFDVLALRKSEAIQIWRENALRAGNRVSDNMKAHYGIESDFKDHRPTYIGSVDSPLNIGDVIATANSDYTGNTNPNTNVGDIAGKGTSALSDNRFKFDAKDFGIIMAISSILPEAEYNAYGLDRMNALLESEDFFIPEYENLGLEPISSQNFVNIPTSAAKVIGFAPRYFGYKTKLDKCFGDFMTGRSFAPWCSPKADVSNALGSPGVMPLNCLYVNPGLFDVNFNVALQNSEQFLNDLFFNVEAVRPMSVVGMPFS